MNPFDVKSFDFNVKVLFGAALALAVVTLVFCCLAVLAGAGEKCTGHEWPLGYRPIDFFGLFLGAAFATTLIGGAALRSRPYRGTFYKVNGVILTFEYVAYRTVLVGILILMLIVGSSIRHWYAIATQCVSQS